MIEIGTAICTNFDEASSREWLETNGIGGFASGTISGANTRRYHGILTAATDQPLGRKTLVSKIEESVWFGADRLDLSTNQYPGSVDPQGFRYIRKFRLDPFPTWTFLIAGLEMEKSIFMPNGENTAVCRWRVASPLKDARLTVRPLLSFADYHALRHEIDGLEITAKADKDVVTVESNTSVGPLYFGHNAAEYTRTGDWYLNFEYAIENERGFDFHEDLFQPFELTFDLSQEAVLIISLRDARATEAADLEQREMSRRRALVVAADCDNELADDLVLAADQFIVRRGLGETVIAGYPWFTDWGRDTMIALPGLTLATKRPGIAKGILREYSKHISQGMLPNRFADAGSEPEYNTADATLWYFEAIRTYLAATEDLAFVRDELYPKLAEIIEWHIKGTRFCIHVDTDGLLHAGEKGTQLTWMDAKVGDHVITPRMGKAVEIQALWYNALMTMAGFAERVAASDDRLLYSGMANRCKDSFLKTFWNASQNCLYDVVSDDSVDASVRPNQIFAVSLYHSMLEQETAVKVVDKVESDLLTPCGLRSLSPKDPSYCPHYIGTPFERDSAYHQGTVWAWLIGPFVDAYRRVHPANEERVRELLTGFKSQLTRAGIGQISEIFDAEPPHAPRGCPAQAWSVAEILRVLGCRATNAFGKSLPP